MSLIKEYDLNAGDTRGSLRVFEMAPYVAKHGEKAFKAHRHDFYQLIWFFEEGEHYVDYKTFRHPKNAFYFVDKKQVHYFCHHSLNEGYLFHFNDSFLNRFEFDNENWVHYKLFHELTAPFLILEGQLFNRVSQLTQLLVEELVAKEFNHAKQSYFIFRLILLNMERTMREKSKPLMEEKGELGEIVRFSRLVEKNLSKSHPIQYYADELGISANKLSSLVNKFLGDSPANVIHEKKAIEAKRLLSNSTLSIKQVGYDLGFSQATYFTKFFKKHTDYTPKEFRNLVESGDYNDH